MIKQIYYVGLFFLVHDSTDYVLFKYLKSKLFTFTTTENYTVEKIIAK